MGPHLLSNRRFSRKSFKETMGNDLLHNITYIQYGIKRYDVNDIEYIVKSIEEVNMIFLLSI